MAMFNSYVSLPEGKKGGETSCRLTVKQDQRHPMILHWVAGSPSASRKKKKKHIESIKIHQEDLNNYGRSAGKNDEKHEYNLLKQISSVYFLDIYISIYIYI